MIDFHIYTHTIVCGFHGQLSDSAKVTQNVNRDMIQSAKLPPTPIHTGMRYTHDNGGSHTVKHSSGFHVVISSPVKFGYSISPAVAFKTH